MTRFRMSVLPLLFLLCWPPAQAQESVLLKAMRDEMGRAMEDLQLGGMDKPYFVSYSVLESTSVRASAVLGAIASSREGSSRLLAVEVRVGDKDLDNTNSGARSGSRPTAPTNKLWTISPRSVQLSRMRHVSKRFPTLASKSRTNTPRIGKFQDLIPRKWRLWLSTSQRRSTECHMSLSPKSGPKCSSSFSHT